ncbi:SLAIN motif-containing protein 1-like [Salarias fasciatus]|uniref:SLAIN motif-containing protein 1-like n=1 Tax=Salarias fasciatus TaxID=181472 RepID=UPI0011769583|nr:SLAIN motif-containing protein 1-like [Salarias fasciatus]
MEAAVLVMPEVECKSLSAELEVKKLQELVRKLERQNEQLRTRSSGPAPGSAAGLCLPGPLPALLCQASRGGFAPPEEPFDYFQPHGAAAAGEEEAEPGPSVLDELELLDLDGVDGSDETWLYVAPGGREAARDCLSPQQWCRQVLDSPRSEVEAARRSLSLRLEQVSRWRSSLSSPAPSTPSSSSPGPPLSRVSPVPASPSHRPERPAPSHSSPLHPAFHRTLSPIGKELSPVAERTPTFLPHPPARSRSLRGCAVSPQSSVDSDLGASEAEDDSIALGYKLQDLTDVQVMARLQEESLRQDLASVSSVLAGRRSQSFTFQLSQLSAGPGLEEEDEEEDDEDYGLLPPPPPRLTRLPHSHTFSSMRDWRRSSSSLYTPPSTPCTPPCPSAGFAFQAAAVAAAAGSPCPAEPQPAFRPGSADSDNKLRRSMPNLVRAPSMPSVPVPANPSASPSLLRNSQSFDSCGGLARLQSSIPSPGQLQHRVQSVGNFSSLSRQPLKATAYVSPTIKGSSCPSPSPSAGGAANSGIPLLSKPAGASASAPRSGLPRPASFVAATSSAPRGKAVQSTRSLLTPPKSLSALSALRDGAWRDGCY